MTKDTSKINCDFYDTIANALYEALPDVCNHLDRQVIAQDMAPSNVPETGPLALKLFRISKFCESDVSLIGNEIVNILKSLDYVNNAMISKSYVNFSISPSFYQNFLCHPDADWKRVHSNTSISERVLVEHTQPNTHKELHIGHIRNTVLGDTLARIYSYYIDDVVVGNYHGDEGVHVAKCLWYITDFLNDAYPDTEKGKWLGEVYAQANREYESTKGTDKELQYRSRISSILSQIENREGEFYDKWLLTRKWSIDQFKTVYDWLGVSFDYWHAESDVSVGSLKRVEEYLKKGVFVKSDGAIGCDLSDEGLGFCLLRKTDGRGLYATKDVELAITRYKEVAADHTVYVVDVRQSLHFKQVFACLRKMGFEAAAKCDHLAYDVVQTKDGQLSSRTGTSLTADVLISSLEESARNNLISRGSDLKSKEGRERIHSISLAAVRYGMLRVEPGKKITFDMDEWLSPEGNTGPYLLYAVARSESILRKAKKQDALANDNVSLSGLNELVELQILTHLVDFDNIVRTAGDKMKPNLLCNYLYDLARLFNQFYNKYPVLSCESREIRDARLNLCRYTSWYLRAGLNILGINPVDKL